MRGLISRTRFFVYANQARTRAVTLQAFGHLLCDACGFGSDTCFLRHQAWCFSQNLLTLHIPGMTNRLSFANLIAALLLMIGASGCTRREPADAPHAAQVLFLNGLDSLHASLVALESSAHSGNRPQLQAAFRKSRALFKQHEALLYANGPSVAGLMNGPLPEDDDGPPQRLGLPAHYQRIETELFGDASLQVDTASVIASARIMLNSLGALRQLGSSFAYSEKNIAEAIRLELARVPLLGMSGTDSGESGDAIAESAFAFDGLSALGQALATGSTHKAKWKATADTFSFAAVQLRTNTNFDSFDRLSFFARDIAASGRALNRVRVAIGGIDTTMRAVWTNRAATVFDSAAFDVYAYAPSYAIRPTAEVIALGETLFNEKRLSGDGSRACSTCHNPAIAFTDGLPQHTVLADSGRKLSRNTPTLLNIALQPSFFADARVTTLEDQIAVVLASKLEMASSASAAAVRLRADTAYAAAFARALPPSAREITESSLRNVLAAYVRTLGNMNSRVDVAMRGMIDALTSDERRGFNLFMGKARCATCHFAPMFSGAIPPTFLVSEVEIIGAPANPDTMAATLDADIGRARVDSIETHRFAFNVPTLRNIARTSPYMHNGAYRTLEQVVDFYNRGGGKGVGAKLTYQTLSEKPLRLTAHEQNALVVFLKALDDRDAKATPRSK